MAMRRSLGFTESVSRVRPRKGGPSMDTSHVSSLELKHAGLEKRLEEEMNRPLPDNAVIQTLKKQKLRIKEELSQL
ncbi:MAG: DUF465 domain-containing protein [Novosphingobium sp.]